jgi:hypothetical protein
MRLALFLLASTLTTAGEFTTSLGDAYPYTISAIACDADGNTTSSEAGSSPVRLPAPRP